MASGALAARAISGLVLAAFGLGVAWLGGIVFAGVIGAVLTLLIIETDRLDGRARPGVAACLAVGSVGVCLALAVTDHYWLALGTVGGGAGLVLVVGGLSGLRGRWHVAVVSLTASIAGLALYWLREAGGGWPVIFWFFAVIWATDTGAYVTGRIVGGAQLAPTISPNKTWAGAIGGLALGTGVGAAVGILICAAASDAACPSLAFILPLAVALSLMGQVGDLAESAFKRYIGVKDSGRLIPGHGGILDRLDSMLAAAPVFGLVIYLTGNAVWGGS